MVVVHRVRLDVFVYVEFLRLPFEGERMLSVLVLVKLVTVVVVDFAVAEPLMLRIVRLWSL